MVGIDPVSEDECQRKHEKVFDKIIESEKKLSEKIAIHEKYLNGEKDIEEGLRYRNQILWLDYQLRRKTTMGWIDWLYRGVMGIGMAWVSYKLLGFH